MKLIKGEDLTNEQREQVLNAFVYRHTAIPYPYANEKEWLVKHSFYFRKDGMLASIPKHCETDYYADEYNKRERDTARTYHLALVKNYRNRQQVILQVRQIKDCLSCEVWHYIGQRVTTKKSLKSKRAELLAWINDKFNQNFTKLVID